MGGKMLLNILVPILIIAFIFILAGCFMFVMRRNKKEIIDRIKCVGDYSDNVLTIDNERYFVQLVKVGSNDDFSINSMNVMQVRYKTGSKLINIAKTELKKIILVYPFNGKLKRYINENEMEFITYKNFFWGMHVCKLSELSEFVKYLRGKHESI